MGKSNQGSLKGINRMCAQCIKECKQFSNILVLRCGFKASQKNDGIPLQAHENRSCRAKKELTTLFQ